MLSRSHPLPFFPVIVTLSRLPTPQHPAPPHLTSQHSPPDPLPVSLSRTCRCFIQRFTAFYTGLMRHPTYHHSRMASEFGSDLDGKGRFPTKELHVWNVRYFSASSNIDSPHFSAFLDLPLFAKAPPSISPSCPVRLRLRRHRKTHRLARGSVLKIQRCVHGSAHIRGYVS
ncbi:hypothetical protein C8R47DRAFT_815198 [Mycena vitilis]|nr:hypothetical protein C8R47DRAFT_815198 [Mycena vitilis]